MLTAFSKSNIYVKHVQQYIESDFRTENFFNLFVKVKFKKDESHQNRLIIRGENFLKRLS